MTTFYICRHGKTEFNQQKRLQGHIDTPLVEEGIKNAEEIAAKLVTVNIDHIVSSDLGRAFRTAYIISRQINYQGEISAENQLRELNFGDLAGMRIEEAHQKYPQLEEVEDYTPPGGEPLNNMRQRILSCLTELSLKYEDQNILLVTHDIVINSIYTTYAGIEFGVYNKEHHNPHNFLAKFSFKSDEIVDFTEFK